MSPGMQPADRAQRPYPEQPPLVALEATVTESEPRDLVPMAPAPEPEPDGHKRLALGLAAGSGLIAVAVVVGVVVVMGAIGFVRWYADHSFG
ncbi:hypothetical protein JCM9957A_01170 [Kineosporia succinea]